MSTSHSDQRASCPNDINTEIANLIESSDHPYSELGSEPPHPADADFPEGYDGSDEPPWAWLYGEDLPTIDRCAAEPQNDTGNGKRLLTNFGNELLHVRDVGWHGWARTHWRAEGGNEIATRCAQITAARIALEANVMVATPLEQELIDAAADAQREMIAFDKISDPTSGQTVKRRRLESAIEAGARAAKELKSRQSNRRNFSVASGNAPRIRGLLDQAMPHRTVKTDFLNLNKLAFNVSNGTLHFICDEMPDPDASDHTERSIRRYRVELRSHNRDDNITMVAPVIYEKDARCPEFSASIERFQPTASVRHFLQRYHGYGLTGLTGEQCLVFNYGTGSNWKSTFVEIIARIMGPYCATIAFESLSGDGQRSGSQATPDLARLPGTRLVRASEPERGVQFKEALIKSLTGGEPMLVRSLNKEFFEFRPHFKMVLSGNHKPEIGGVDHGIWRRMKFVLWPVTIPDGEKRQMDDVLEELWAERSGILNWLIEGCLDYLNDGLRTPQEIVDSTASYREEMDPVGAFVGACVVAAPKTTDGLVSTVPARAMYNAYLAWAYANAVRAWKEKSFAMAMSQKGFTKEKHVSGLRYLSVRLENVPDRPSKREDNPSQSADDDAVPV